MGWLFMERFKNRKGLVGVCFLLLYVCLWQNNAANSPSKPSLLTLARCQERHSIVSPAARDCILSDCCSLTTSSINISTSFYQLIPSNSSQPGKCRCLYLSSSLAARTHSAGLCFPMLPFFAVLHTLSPAAGCLLITRIATESRRKPNNRWK